MKETTDQDFICYQLCTAYTLPKLLLDEYKYDLDYFETIEKAGLKNAPYNPKIAYYLVEVNETKRENKIIYEYSKEEKIDLRNYSIECLVLTDIDYTNLDFPLLLPESVESLQVQGGEFRFNQVDETPVLFNENGETLETLKSALYKYFSSIQEYSAMPKRISLSQRITIEAKIQEYSELLSKNVKISCIPFIKKIKRQCKLKNLSIVSILLSDTDLEKISSWNLNELILFYTARTDISILPSSLSSFSFHGDGFSDLKKINFRNTNLKFLDLWGQGLRKLENFSFLSHLEEFILSQNMIAEFNLKKLPPSLVCLDLSSNILDNLSIDFGETPHTSMRTLDLSKNHLEINYWFLAKIMQKFPLLEKLVLTGNDVSGVYDGIVYNVDEYGNFVIPEEVNEEEYEFDYNCLPAVQKFLFESDYNMASLIEGQTFKEYDEYQVELIWSDIDLSASLALNVMQKSYAYFFQKYVEKEINTPDLEKNLIFYEEGVYIHIRHYPLTLQCWIEKDQPHSIKFKATSDNPHYVNRHVPSYFNDMKSKMEGLCNHSFIPFISICINGKLLQGKELFQDDYMYNYYCSVYGLKNEIGVVPILFPYKNKMQLQVIKVKYKKFLEFVEKDSSGFSYFLPIEEVVFIFVTSKGATVYKRTQSGELTNYPLECNSMSASIYSYSLRLAKDKEDYINQLTNPSLSYKYRLYPGTIYLKKERNQEVSILYNSHWCEEREQKLYLNNKEDWIIDEQYLKEAEIKKDRILKLKKVKEEETDLPILEFSYRKK